ncbi:MAG: 3-oxoacyl-(Acyl-carrier-protein) reductase [uncultured bacterium]|nr:MAG: 3-oxoacyl-(Acyl-carrier-protein) reductase [uncultured bacterium]OGT08380.1 MAG: 3-oxoacyl-[acyl-carrier-protein] reductase [Gammaproteobacteria bacterium RBG_16_37_9]HBC72017.1 3-oxoacyl-ACP reductase [Coxiellaceae bacterium]HBS52214.1 3-oxoacyl-ACP reductase [Coxiellaceae bacterium]HBY56063.1 3-oxoacyl-ACP reductase [Coxiellaceae bacterium]
MSLQDKVALVTGASRGIGKVILERLAKDGAIAIGVDYSEEYANTISVSLKELGFKGEGFVMDVTKQDSIENCMELIAKKYGSPSILINNAGITRDNLMLRMSQEEWDQVIATNLTSVFRLSRICIRDMVKARFGKIVNISSVIGYTGNAGQANYAATKAGVVAFSKALALEVASRNITVNCIAPGFIETDMTKKLSDEQREKLLSVIPMKRIGQPDDIANAVEFLVSDSSSYITGTTIHVNGGMYMI